MRDDLNGKIMADILALCGVGLLALAGWRMHPSAGLAVLGVALLLIGVRLARAR